MVQPSDTGTATGGRAVEYTTPGNAGGIAPHVEMNTAVVTPTDRVRWGPIIAGLFAALSTLVVLGVLGLAVGLTAYDPVDRGRNYGLGAGVWGGLSALIAFALGGWLAARTAAVGGHRNGLLNGTMVWAVAIPLLMYSLAGAASMANAARNVSNSPNDIAASADRSGGTGRTTAGPDGTTIQQSSPTLSNAGSSIDRDEATRAARRAAWGTLVSLLLSLGAAAMGGHLGARSVGLDRKRATA